MALHPACHGQRCRVGALECVGVDRGGAGDYVAALGDTDQAHREVHEIGVPSETARALSCRMCENAEASNPLVGWPKYR